MNIKQALKEFQDYFTDIEWNDHAVRKVEGILTEMSTKTVIKKEVVIRHKYIHLGKQVVRPTRVNFKKIEQDVCAYHNIPLGELFIQNRKTEYVNARADFVLRVKSVNPTQSPESIGRVMGRDRTTVINILEGIVNGRYKIGEEA